MSPLLLRTAPVLRLGSLAAVLGATVLPLVACGGGAADDVDTTGIPATGVDATTDPQATSSSTTLEQQLATLTRDLTPSDAASGSGPSYFELRRDLRRCASPLCGGFFVQRVNRLTAVCADGSRSAECYVADLDLSTLGLGSEQATAIEGDPESFLLEGEVVRVSSGLGDVGRLNVTEAWQGHPGVNARGAFLRVQSSGIVCITSPCLSLSAELLNSRLPAVAIAAVDLDAFADPSDGLEQVNAPGGLLVAAMPSIVSGPGGRALGLDASEYFVPVTADKALCGTRGAPVCADGSFCDFPAGSDCGRADAPGTCAPTPELCVEIFAPVCGCDGQTYDNSCFANAAGVSVETEGPCASEPEGAGEPSGAACGSRGLPACPEGEFCAFPPESDCGRADKPGTCATKPQACIQLFDPVCGCDGQTHGNACSAASAGVSVDFDGACSEAP
jgi:uncharacterized protein DUF6748/Kazal-type serine protease inhibitor-like protein